MRKRDKIKELFKGAKETLIAPYSAIKKKLEVYIEPEEKGQELNWDKYMNIRIRCFHATNNTEVAKIYMSGQQDVLKEFNISGVTSAKNNTWENENTYIFIAEDVKTGEIGAGMRLDVADINHKLPLEMALENQVDDLSQRIHRFDHVIAEACGWWVKKSFSERRLPKFTLLAGIAIAPKLRINYIVAFPHQHTISIMTNVGFTIAKTIGTHEGSFIYPDERYNSTIVEINAVTLDTTDNIERERILSLRTNPVQSFIEKHKNYTTKFDFDLRLS